MEWWKVLIFVLLVGWLGIFFSIPTKRLLINQEMLRFPSGYEMNTCQALHGVKSCHVCARGAFLHYRPITAPPPPWLALKELPYFGID
jgi:hypothetical protein